VTGGDLVSRYQCGEHDQVWSALRARGSPDDADRAEALAVADLTMRRVRHDAELLTSRLAARGWKALTGALLAAPTEADFDAILSIVRTTGAPIPASLDAFWTIVGGIDCVWDYRDGSEAPNLGVGVPMVEMDPLCIDRARDAVTQLDAWQEQGEDGSDLGPATLDLAPDSLHKANVSGGAYGIDPLFPGADPIFVGEEHGLPFVDYLRLAFRWGGFPRLERHAGRPDVQTFVREMTAGMIGF
jgi:hypothetical protein